MKDVEVPVDRGDTKWYNMLSAPAECPNNVIVAGLPPNAAMLSRIHTRARYWSSRARLPRADLDFSVKNAKRCKR